MRCYTNHSLSNCKSFNFTIVIQIMCIEYDREYDLQADNQHLLTIY